MNTDHSAPEDSPFRRWFRDCLKTLPGNTVEWPALLRHILAEEFQELRNSDQYYRGDVFKNRDEEVAMHRERDCQDEEILVYRLYAAVHEKYLGVLHIGDTPVWLFSCEVPNQGKELSLSATGSRNQMERFRKIVKFLTMFAVSSTGRGGEEPIFSGFGKTVR